MKIYGTGTLDMPGSGRTVWDFVDGPFDTSNVMLIEEARRRGFSFEPPKEPKPPKPVKEEKPVVKEAKPVVFKEATK